MRRLYEFLTISQLFYNPTLALLVDHFSFERILFLFDLTRYYRSFGDNHCTREGVYEIVVLTIREGLQLFLQFHHILFEKYRSSSEPSV